MLAGARSFGHGPTKRSPSPSSRSSEKVTERPRLDRMTNTEGFRGFGWRPKGFRPESGANEELRTHTLSKASKSRSSASAEQPVRTQPRPITPRKSRESIRKSQKHSASHDSNAVAPSVAALLAVTSIPRRKRFEPSRKANRVPRQMSLVELREEWHSLNAVAESLTGTSPNMDVLLSPPDIEEDDFDDHVGRLNIQDDRNDDNEDDVDSVWLPSRSTSSDSMPSLAQDDASMQSWKSSFSPHSPMHRRLTLSKQERVPYSPKSVDSILDHPLIDLEEEESNDATTETRRIRTFPKTRPTPELAASNDSAPSSLSKQPTPRGSTFRSNLTASLQALRRAASSLSNFTAPSMVPDDHVSRGLLGPNMNPTWPSEKRPRQLNGVPTPQLRRYLNPPQHGLPTRQKAHDFHLHNSHIDHIDLEAAAHPFKGMSAMDTEVFPEGSVIPLQDYNGSEARRGRDRNGRLLSGSDNDRAGGLLQQQRREPRENSEFLRICVLELNMRRQGKMEGPLGMGPGRKAWWLPPRELGTTVARDDGCDEEKPAGGVPRRWQGVTCDYD